MLRVEDAADRAPANKSDDGAVKRKFKLRDIEGFGPKLCNRIEEAFPDDSWVSAPYLLARVHGVGFRRADSVAMALGVKADDPQRINAAAFHVLGEAESAGNTCQPIQDFGKALASCLQITLPASLDFDDSIYEEGGLISRVSTTRAERAVAMQMRVFNDRTIGPEHLRAPGAGDLSNGSVLGGRDRFAGLAEDQSAALKLIDGSNVFALLGGPGVGKTFLVKRIAEWGGRVELCAPTGKAAVRIEELTGRPAQTIHRLLEVTDNGPAPHSSKFRFKRNLKNPLSCDLVICDEASMVDVKLMADLCDALGSARLILVGDPFQLPSVGPGAVLRDLTAHSAIPHVELTELKRQDPSLLIARNCKSIRFDKRVIVNNQAASDFFFVPCDDPIETRKQVVEFATQRLPEKYGLDAKTEVMVLAPLREKGELSVKALNVALRARLNPDAVNYWRPWTGDRVIQKSNNYDLGIFNGSIGTVLEATETKLKVVFDTPEIEIEADRDDFNLDLAYALTVHRAQGSEAPAVVFVVDPSGPAQYLADAQLTYTGISRAREVCVCIGSRRALEAQAGRHRAVNRWTRLGAFLKS